MKAKRCYVREDNLLFWNLRVLEDSFVPCLKTVTKKKEKANYYDALHGTGPTPPSPTRSPLLTT